MKPIHKFNGGLGATLCHKCSVIISTGLTDDLYCKKCNVMNIEKEFLPYEESFNLKEIGFDEDCIAYRDCRNAPLYRQAFNWFRKEHQLVHEIYMYKSKHGVSYGWDIFSTVLPTDDELGDEGDKMDYKQKTLESNESLIHSRFDFQINEHEEYELAELECIKEMIHIIKQRQHENK